ncbi:hypothetical protein Y032_0074g894 [Ancylostoma ceylanicum]|nr:hypothetical protein Y032_0074g894 [Ancylostoma ceylanicum]
MSTPASKTQQETLEDTKDKNRTEDMKAKNKVPIQKEVVKDKDKVASQKEGIKEKEKKKYKSESAPSENTDHDAPPLQRRSNDESDKVYTKKQLEILLGVHQETTPLIQPKEANTQNCGVDAVEISQPGSINMNSSISTRRSKKRARLPDIKTDITEASACRKSVQDSLITNGSLNQELKPVTHLLDVKKEEEVQPTQAPDLSENDSIRTAVG